MAVASRRDAREHQRQAALSRRVVVDYEGEVLESFVTTTRDKKAALKFLRKAMKCHGRPEEVVTDRLRTYSAALKEMGRGDDRKMGRWANTVVFSRPWSTR
jgi:transposase-like protein